MKRSRKLLALLVGSALVAGALFTGMASADSSTLSTGRTLQASDTANKGPAEEDPTGPDTDNLQEGDQTAPDDEKGEKEAPETEAESEKESDGPRGHEDPPGDVNHEFEGEE